MGVKTLTLYQVPADVRAKGAAQARQQIHQLLSNPSLTAEQRKELLDRLRWANKWESLDIEEVLPRLPALPEAPPEEAPPREPQHHAVEIVESLNIEEQG